MVLCDVLKWTSCKDMLDLNARGPVWLSSAIGCRVAKNTSTAEGEAGEPEGENVEVEMDLNVSK